MKKNNGFRIAAALVLLSSLAALCACPSGAAQFSLAWLKQGGTGAGSDDTGSAVYAGREIFLAGYTGPPSGQQDGGVQNSFVMAYDTEGKALWQKQFGTGQDTYARGVYADAGGVYLTGSTTGAFPGFTGAGDVDAYVYKMDASGNFVWVNQFGGPQNDYAYSVFGGGSYLYVVGVTFGDLPGQTAQGGADIFLMKIDPSGKEIWTRQFGTPTNDYSYSACVDSSGIYVAGTTYGQISPLCGLGGAEAFVRKYDLQGNEAWTQQWGTDLHDYANAVSAGNDGIYVLGITYGALTADANRGQADAFLSKLSFDGEIVWTRQFGTDTTDFAWGASADGDRVYITGYTSGTFAGQVNAGQYDAYTAAFDAAGNLLWLKEYGTPRDDYTKGVSVGSGGVYIAGSTWGSFSARSGSDSDAFTARFTP